MFKRIAPLAALLLITACVGMQGGNNHACPYCKEQCQCKEHCKHCDEVGAKDVPPCPVCLED